MAVLWTHGRVTECAERVSPGQGDLTLALVSLALQQLALLVLPHFLAAFLDHTTHGAPRCRIIRLAIAEEY